MTTKRTRVGVLVWIGTFVATTMAITLLGLALGLPDGSVLFAENGLDFFLGVMQVGVGWYYAHEARKWYEARKQAKR